jgi:hypothetical protein
MSGDVMCEACDEEPVEVDGLCSLCHMALLSLADIDAGGPLYRLEDVFPDV